MTKYCPIFILSLAGMQQDRNSGLARNYGAPICQKSVQGSCAKWTKFQSRPEYRSCFFRLLSNAHRNTGPQQSGKSGCRKAK